VKPPIDSIEGPPFPRGARWLNSEPLEMAALRGRAVILEFWDFCRPHSLRTLPYLKAWHERYGDRGLVVVSVHAPGFRASADEDAVREAVARLGIVHPVLLDTDFALWREYENAGWPGRYLWGVDGMLADYHYGEGAYEECELAIGEALGLAVEPLAPLRAEDASGAVVVAPSTDRLEPPFDGPYEAGAVWAVIDGRGRVRVNGREVEVAWPGAHLLIEHDGHGAGELVIEPGQGIVVEAVCFTPGTAVAQAPARRDR
jgi:hypothetical protein